MKSRTTIMGILLALLATVVAGGRSVAAESRPRLVVNIVVSGMSVGDLERYSAGFGDGGFRLLMGGTEYPYAHYDFAPTTPSALATLTTGANPSLHGVVGYGWWNRTTGEYTSSVGDSHFSTFNVDTPESRVANTNLSVESLGDVVVRNIEGGRSVSVAADPSSAIVMGGVNPSEVWWLDSLSGTWTTSTRYANSLPKWVKTLNNQGAWWRKQYTKPWVLSHGNNYYRNSHSTVVKPYGYKPSKEESSRKAKAADVLAMSYSYVCNSVVADAAKEAIIYNRLGGDGATDVLNVCFDAPRRIAARYGLHSREMEDMYYRLDESLADLVKFASAQAGGNIVVVLASDGECRPTDGSGNRLFNSSQARFLISSFLSATHGKGDWVLGYERGGVWLNHNLIFSRGLSLEDVQRQVAAFVLQLRGVSHAVTASELAGGGVKQGLVSVVQSGFYPRHSADVQLVLMPDWCEVESEEVRPHYSSSLPYAPYRRAYVALWGEGVRSGHIVERSVNVGSVVVTLAEMVGVGLPLGAEQPPLGE